MARPVWIAAALAALALSGTVTSARLYGAEPGAIGMTCQDSSHVAPDGTLRIDSSAAAHEFGWRRYAMTAAGFASGERYRVTFRARVAEHGGKAFLYVLVRPKGQSGDEKDLASLKVAPTGGGWKDCEMTFEVGGEGTTASSSMAGTA